MNQFGLNRLTPVVKGFLMINVIMFIITLIGQESAGVYLNDILGLHWFNASKYEHYQIVTHIFMHGNFYHLLFNMLALVFIGPVLEQSWGTKRFFNYYLITGFGASFFHYMIMYFGSFGAELEAINLFLDAPTTDTFNHLLANSDKIGSNLTEYGNEVFDKMAMGNATPEIIEICTQYVSEYSVSFQNFPVIVGASGSLFGLLLGLGVTFPEMELSLLFLPIGIKAKYFVLIYGTIELLLAKQDYEWDRIAHFAHLGGLIFGIIVIQIWQLTKK